MKKYSNWLFVALTFVCFNLSAQDIFLSTTSAKLAKSPTPTPSVGQTAQPTPPPTVQQAATKSIQRFKTQHMTNSIQVDTNGQAMKKSIIDRLNSNNPQKEQWDAQFVNDEKTRQMLFKEGLVIEVNMVKSTTNKGLTTPLMTKGVSYETESIKVAESPAPTFPTGNITVKFENGNLVPITDLTSTQKKAIIDSLTKPIMPASTAEIVENLRRMSEEQSNVTESIFLSSNKSFMLRNRSENEDEKEEEIAVLPDVEIVKLAKKKIVKKEVKEHTERPIRKEYNTYEEGVTPLVIKTKIKDNDDFIDRYWTIAHNGNKYGVPHWLTLGQAIQEGTGGRSWLAYHGNNQFGIKCNGGECKNTKSNHLHLWVYDDFKYGKNKHKESFRAYRTVEESFDDHIQFFRDSKRYAHFLSVPNNDIQMKLYLLWLSEYATDEMYDYRISQLVKRYGLYCDKNGDPIPFSYDRQKTAKRYKEMLKNRFFK